MDEVNRLGRMLIASMKKNKSAKDQFGGRKSMWSDEYPWMHKTSGRFKQVDPEQKLQWLEFSRRGER